MRFLGDLTDEQRPQVERALAQVAAHTPVIQARLSQAGTFPATPSLRVIWVGIDQGAEELSRVAEALEHEVTRLGLPAADKPFVAHVTLGRVRFPKPRPQLFESIQTCAWMPPPAFSLTHVTLFQSVLSSAGPTYTALARAPFHNA
jgi:2'-5' RNA ligase